MNDPSDESDRSTAADEAISWYQQRVEELGRSQQAQARAEALARYASQHEALTAFFQAEDEMLEATLGFECSETGVPSSIRYFGEYVDLVKIAQGGMGIVFKARHARLNRTVALKMIRAGELATAEEVKRFYSEAEAAATLDHPNIVPIFEVGKHAGRHYYSMAYVDGQDLLELLKKGLPASRIAAGYAATIADAIHYAHSKGVIHRDIKPSNVLIDKTGQLRITDFGLAKQIGSDLGLTRSLQMLGTPSYMSPEQARGSNDQVHAATDIYSIGALLYALITGRPPFYSENNHQTLADVQDKDPVPPRKLNPHVARDLETITLKCLEKDPLRRYESAVAMADDLRRYLRGEAVAARPITYVERAWRWCKRHPTGAALGFVVAISLLVLATTGWIFSARLSTSLRRETAAKQRSQKLATTNATLVQIANRERDKAVQREKEAKSRAAEAKAHTLALEAETSLDVDPERSLLLAAEAVEVTRRIGNPASAVAHQTLEKVLRQFQSKRLGAVGAEQHIEFSANSRWLLTESVISAQGETSIYDLSDRKSIQVMQGRFALSPDRNFVAIWHFGTISILKLGDDATHLVARFEQDAQISHLNLSAGARWLAVKASANPVQYDADELSSAAWHLWDLRKEESPRCFHDLPEITEFAIHGDWYVSLGGQDSIELFDLRGTEPQSAYKLKAFSSKDTQSPIRKFFTSGFSIDCAWYAVRTSASAFSLLDLRSYEQRTVEVETHVDVSEFPANPLRGRWLVQSDGDKVVLWDLHAPDPSRSVITLRPPTSAGDAYQFFETIHISPCGRWAVTSGTWERGPRIWRLKDVGDSAQATFFTEPNGRNNGGVSSYLLSHADTLFHPDGTFVTCQGRLFDLRGDVPHEMPTGVILGFGADGKTVSREVLEDGQKWLSLCSLPDSPSSLLEEKWRVPLEPSNSGFFSPNGHLALVFDEKSNELVIYSGRQHPNRLVPMTIRMGRQASNTIAFAPNGSWFVTGEGITPFRTENYRDWILTKLGAIRLDFDSADYWKWNEIRLEEDPLYSPRPLPVAGAAETLVLREARLWDVEDVTIWQKPIPSDQKVSDDGRVVVTHTGSAELLVKRLPTNEQVSLLHPKREGVGGPSSQSQQSFSLVL